MRYPVVRLVVVDGRATLVADGHGAPSADASVRRAGLLVLLCSALLAAGFLLAGGSTGSSEAAVGAAGGATFSRITIDQGGCAQTIRVNNVGDVDGDGRQDILTAGESGVYWFDNPRWGCHAVASGRYGEGATIFAFDVNGDGATDV